MTPTDDLVPSQIERIAVGQILFSSDVIVQAARQLRVEHFGDGPCRTIYTACLDMWRDGRSIDILTVTVELKKMGLLVNVGGAHFLSACMYPVASTKNFDDHAQIIRDYYGVRVLRKAGHQLLTGSVEGADPNELLGALSLDVDKASMVHLSDDVNAAEVAYTLMNTSDKPKPIFLGVDSLDSLVFIMPDNMVTIKADAGVGKTALLISAILNLLPVKKPWVVSLEMSANEWVTRCLCQLAQVDIDLALMDRMSPEEKERMAKAANDHADILGRMDIDDTGMMNIDVFRAKAKHKVDNEGVELIAIDYGQLMDASIGKGDNGTKELELISKGIRATARTLNIPILCIVHVNKDGSDHGTKQFEKDAHVRLSLTRQLGASTMDIEVLKNRNGRVGSVQVPCEMRHGIVGRNGPPRWPNTSHTPKPRIEAPHPDNWTEPNF